MTPGSSLLGGDGDLGDGLLFGRGFGGSGGVGGEGDSLDGDLGGAELVCTVTCVII